MALVDVAEALYLCDEGSGTDVGDSTTNARDGTLINSAAFGTVGGEACLDFTTTTTDRAFFVDMPAGNAAITCMFKVYMSTLTTAAFVMDKYLTTNNARQWRISIQTDGAVDMQISNAGTALDDTLVSGAGVITTGSWISVAVIFADAASGAEYAVHKNGSATAHSTDTTTVASIFDGTSLPVEDRAEFVFPTHGAHGAEYAIRHVCILDRAATTQEIADHHNSVFGISTNELSMGGVIVLP